MKTRLMLAALALIIFGCSGAAVPPRAGRTDSLLAGGRAQAVDAVSPASGRVFELSAPLPANGREDGAAEVVRPLLDRLKQAVSRAARPKVLIEAHTWDIGRERTNQRLTQARAEAVRRRLIKSLGLGKADVIAVGRGESSPLTANRTPKGREANRRIRIVVLDQPGQPAEVRAAAKEPIPPEATLRFDSASAEADDLEADGIKAMAGYLFRNPKAVIQVSGHTDSLGGREMNLALSRLRAVRVKDALTARYGISPERVRTMGYGESRPAADNSTLEGRRLNRRVALSVVNEPPLVREAGAKRPAAHDAGALGAAVLCYHGFDMGTRYSINTSEFKRQIDYMLANGYNIISIQELAAHIDAGQTPPGKSVVITMDDGWKSAMRGFKILKERNLPFTIFLTMNCLAVGKSGSILSQEDLDVLAAYPKTTFADHSYSHSARLARRPFRNREAQIAYLQNDISRSKERFKKATGRSTEFFAYPYGAYSKLYTSMLKKAGFKYLFTVHHGLVKAGADPDLIPRVGAHSLKTSRLEAMFERERKTRLAQKPEPNGCKVSRRSLKPDLARAPEKTTAGTRIE